MAPLQPSVSVPPSITASPSPIGGGVGGAAMTQGGNDLASVEQLVLDLCDPLLRENALVELSKVWSRTASSSRVLALALTVVVEINLISTVGSTRKSFVTTTM
jgi:hypothetical protein